MISKMQVLVGEAILIAILTPVSHLSAAQFQSPTLEQFGKALYQDQNLSLNRNQSCESCHSLTPAQLPGASGFMPAPGFIDPDNILNGTAVSDGSIPGATGGLNVPSSGYAAFNPYFHWNGESASYVGGQFWNGRAPTLAEQAKGPFLNPVEMAMQNQWAVVSRLGENTDYINAFQNLFGMNILAIPVFNPSKPNEAFPAGVTETYNAMATAIASFEKTRELNKFNSKFDFVLAGKTKFTEQERKGYKLFNGKAKCSECHTSNSTVAPDGSVFPPLFTNYSYANIGLPRNINIPNNPEPNLGLGGRTEIALSDPQGDQIGKHKAVSLRNIALTPPYGHNGVLLNLQQVVHFFNTRDVLGFVQDVNDQGFGINGWPAPEIAKNVNADLVGKLKLTAQEEAQIVEFLKTLTDDYPEWGGDAKVPPGTSSPFANTSFPPIP